MRPLLVQGREHRLFAHLEARVESLQFLYVFSLQPYERRTHGMKRNLKNERQEYANKHVSPERNGKEQDARIRDHQQTKIKILMKQRMSRSS